MNETANISYRNVRYKGCRPAHFTGNGKIIFAEGSVVFEGKKPLSIWWKLAALIGIPTILYYWGSSMADNPGRLPNGILEILLTNPVHRLILDFLIIILIVALGRQKASSVVSNSSVKAIIEDRKNQRYLLLVDEVGESPTCIAWQMMSDAAAFSTALRERFPSVIREEDVKGTKTF